MKWQLSPKLCAVATIIAFMIAAISFLGIILKNDMVGRFLFGSTWAFIGIWWLGKFFQIRKRTNN